MESIKVVMSSIKGNNVATGLLEDTGIYAVWVDDTYTATIAWCSDKLQFSKAIDPIKAKQVAKSVAEQLKRKVVIQMPPNVPDSFYDTEESYNEDNDDFDA